MTTTINQPQPATRYTPGYTGNATAFMAQRTLESHGRFVLPLLEPGQEILDAGCGPGTITHGLAEAAMPGRVTGVDREASQIARARQIAEGLEIINARFTTAPADQLPFAAASFDLVFSHALFEHLARPHLVLAEFRRVLRPGGLVALCSPDWDAFELAAPTDEAVAALVDYRALQERNGGDTRAGACLTAWLTEAGFGIISQGQRFENYESADRIAKYLALQLEAGGQPDPARALREWATRPGAELRGCWKHAIAIRWNR